VNKDIEFDVFFDGEHHKRITEGILVAWDGDDIVCYGGRCGKELLFHTMNYFTDIIVENGWQEEFHLFLKSCIANEMDI
jgi:hypothetical protein